MFWHQDGVGFISSVTTQQCDSMTEGGPMPSKSAAIDTSIGSFRWMHPIRAIRIALCSVASALRV